MTIEITELPLEIANDINKSIKNHISNLKIDEQFEILFKTIVILTTFTLETKIENNYIAKKFIAEELHKSVMHHIDNMNDFIKEDKI